MLTALACGPDEFIGVHLVEQRKTGGIALHGGCLDGSLIFNLRASGKWWETSGSAPAVPLLDRLHEAHAGGEQRVQASRTGR